MRIWDLPPQHLCRKHLLGEHRELHAIWSILTRGKKGYKNHPETKRWEYCGWALSERHDVLVTEMEQRGYAHKSPLPCVELLRGLGKLPGKDMYPTPITPINEQKKLLRQKGCECEV